LNYFLLIRTFIAAIKTVETMMPASKGKDKFTAALAIVDGIVGNVESYVPALQVLATLAVTTFRATGTFAKQPAPALK